MRIIVPENAVIVRDSTLGRRTFLMDSGGGRVWRIATAFEGRGIHVRNADESGCDIMQVFPLSQNAVHLVQYSRCQTEPYEERIQELEHAIQITLEENKHLADGNVCTLKLLKDVVSST